MSTVKSHLDSLIANRQRGGDNRLMATHSEQSSRELGQKTALAGDLNEIKQVLFDLKGRMSTMESGVLADVARGQQVNAQRDEAFGKGLRDQLLTEIDQMRNDLANLSRPGNMRDSQKMVDEIQQVSAAVQKLQQTHASTPDQLGRMSSGLNDIHQQVNDLARKAALAGEHGELLRSLDENFKSIAGKLDHIPQTDNQAVIGELSAKLEALQGQLSNFHDPDAYQAIENQLMELGSAISNIATIGTEQLGSLLPSYFESLEKRLDEITRAVAATTSAAAQPLDHSAFDRIEARIASLAKTVDHLSQDQSLAAKQGATAALDSLARQFSGKFDALERQLGELSQSPARVDDHVYDAVNHQLVKLSQQVEAMSTGQMPVAAGISEGHIGEKLDEMMGLLEGAIHANRSQQDGIEQKFNHFAQSLQQSFASQGEAQLKQSEQKILSALQTISDRVDGAMGQQGESRIDPGQLASLENQLRGIADHLQSHNQSEVGEQLQTLASRLEETTINSHTELMQAVNQIAARPVTSPSGDSNTAALYDSLGHEIEKVSHVASQLQDNNEATFDAVRQSLDMILNRVETIENRLPSGDFVEEVAQASFLKHVKAAEERSEAISAPDPLWAEGPMSKPEHFAEPEPVDELNKPNEESLPHRDRDGVAGPIPNTFSEGDDPWGDLGGQGFDAQARSDELPHSYSPPLDGESPLPNDQAFDHTAFEDQGPSDLTQASLNDMPIEPNDQAFEPLGSEVPHLDQTEIHNSPHSEPEPGNAEPTDFIAAARRAAKLAQQKAQEEEASVDEDEAAPKKKSSLMQALQAKKKPALLAAAVIALLVVGGPIAKNMIFSGSHKTAAMNSVDPTQKPSENEQTVAEQAQPVNETSQPVEKAQTERSIDLASNKADLTSEPKVVREVQLDQATNNPRSVEEQPDIKNDDNSNEVKLMSTALDRMATDVDSPALKQTIQPVSMKVPVEIGPVVLRQAAESGDPKALFEVGRRYTSGINGNPDLKKAFEWYKLSAERNFAPAQYRLGNFYEKGHGVERDVEKAAQWYKKAADQGNALAMHNLAVISAMGVLKTGADLEGARRWFSKAAQLGIKDSQVNLGVIYAKGMGMEKDISQGYKWFAIAAKAGDKDAAEKRDIVAKALRPEQIETLRAEVENWEPGKLDERSNSLSIPDAWKINPQTTASLNSKATIKKTQEILNKLGFNAGVADGKIGARTRNAIKTFQSRAGIKANGEITMELLEALARSAG